MREERYDFPIYNGDVEAIPGFSIVKVKASDSFSQNGRDFFVVEQPDDTDPSGFMLTCPQAVSAGNTGHALSIFKGGWVNYTGSVAPGDDVGPTNGSWSVSSTGTGMVVWMVDSSNQRCWVVGFGGGGGCDEFHELSIEGNPTSGTFTWRYQIDSNNDDLEFDFDSTAAEAETVFEGHTDISAGQVDVTGGPLPHVALYVEFSEVSVTAVPSLVANALSQEVSDPFDPQPKLRTRA